MTTEAQGQPPAQPSDGGASFCRRVQICPDHPVIIRSLDDLPEDQRISLPPDTAGIIQHYAPIYNVLSGVLWYEYIGGRWIPVKERIIPGSVPTDLYPFIRGLRDHDHRLIIGRYPKTLLLEDTPIGTRYTCYVVDTDYGTGLIKSVRREDITGSSFAFSLDYEDPDVTRLLFVNDNGEEAEKLDDVTMIIREVLKISKMYDVGPVTYPAYESQEIQVQLLEGRSAGHPDVMFRNQVKASVVERFGQAKVTTPRADAARRKMLKFGRNLLT